MTLSFFKLVRSIASPSSGNRKSEKPLKPKSRQKSRSQVKFVSIHDLTEEKSQSFRNKVTHLDDCSMIMSPYSTETQRSCPRLRRDSKISNEKLLTLDMELNKHDGPLIPFEEIPLTPNAARAESLSETSEESASTLNERLEDDEEKGDSEDTEMERKAEVISRAVEMSYVRAKHSIFGGLNPREVWIEA
ncbi:hypothetical protein BKA69DRAFT_1042475 [Paraphysoderma sedebokerense]|nr:hypothetical protein BKA69DRAFT_1042475 [Paraphysoderma sedebokerense]